MEPLFSYILIQAAPLLGEAKSYHPKKPLFTMKSIILGLLLQVWKRQKGSNLIFYFHYSEVKISPSSRSYRYLL